MVPLIKILELIDAFMGSCAAAVFKYRKHLRFDSWLFLSNNADNLFLQDVGVCLLSFQQPDRTKEIQIINIVHITEIVMPKFLQEIRLFTTG